MSELRKATTDDAYFVTFTIVGWIDIFTRKKYCTTILESWQFCRERKGLKVFEYVIMPSHIHAIMQAENLSDVIRDFKAFTAKAIIKQIQENEQESRKDWLLHLFRYHAKYQKQNEEFQFWQKTNHPIILDNAEIFQQKANYIWQNPVVAGYVTDAESWRYSSACKDGYFKVDES